MLILSRGSDLVQDRVLEAIVVRQDILNGLMRRLLVFVSLMWIFSLVCCALFVPFNNK